MFVSALCWDHFSSKTARLWGIFSLPFCPVSPSITLYLVFKLHPINTVAFNVSDFYFVLIYQLTHKPPKTFLSLSICYFVSLSLFLCFFLSLFFLQWDSGWLSAESCCPGARIIWSLRPAVIPLFILPPLLFLLLPYSHIVRHLKKRVKSRSMA